MKKRFSASINIIADQKFGKDMKKKKDKTIQKDVYTYEKKMEKKKEFEDYVNLVRSVLPDRVVVL